MQNGDGPDDIGWFEGPGGRSGPGGGTDATRGTPDPDATQVIGGPVRSGEPGGLVLGGRYRLEGLLGTGGMTEVHRAADLRLNRPVAVKIFRAGTDRDGERRFQDEARTLANLSHPGLVAVHDSGVERDQLYLVMELVNGWTLRKVLAQERLPLAEITRIGVALADVLGYVHQQGVVHRDVKPSNVLIGRDNRVRLADFGITTPSVGRRSGHGTAAYLSPEEVRGDWVGPPADVYALGLVLLEAFTGRQGYPGIGPDAAAERLSRSPVIPAELPDGMRRALSAMTDPDPQVRPTAPQVAAMLGRGSAPVATADLEQPERSATRQILAIALGALLLAALIGFVAFATGDDTSTEAQPSATNAPATRRPAPAEPRTTATNTAPKLPSAPSITLPSAPNISLPDLPDLPELPDAPEVPASVLDDVQQAWRRFTDWLASLF